MQQVNQRCPALAGLIFGLSLSVGSISLMTSPTVLLRFLVKKKLLKYEGVMGTFRLTKTASRSFDSAVQSQTKQA